MNFRPFSALCVCVCVLARGAVASARAASRLNAIVRGVSTAAHLFGNVIGACVWGRSAGNCSMGGLYMGQFGDLITTDLCQSVE